MKRRYITHAEWRTVLESVSGKHQERDRCMIYMMYTHGLRVSEATQLKLSHLDMTSGYIYINRLKNGYSVSHPVPVDEMKILQQWLSKRKEYPGNQNSDYLFISEDGKCLSRQRVYNIIKKYGQLSGIDNHLHPHKFRHGCGFALAEKGVDTRLIQDYLGHRNIQHTVHYTQSNPARFRRIWGMQEP